MPAGLGKGLRRRDSSLVGLVMMDDRIGGPVVVANSRMVGDVTGATAKVGKRTGRAGQVARLAKSRMSRLLTPMMRRKGRERGRKIEQRKRMGRKGQRTRRLYSICSVLHHDVLYSSVRLCQEWLRDGGAAVVRESEVRASNGSA